MKSWTGYKKIKKKTTSVSFLFYFYCFWFLHRHIRTIDASNYYFIVTASIFLFYIFYFRSNIPFTFKSMSLSDFLTLIASLLDVFLVTYAAFNNCLYMFSFSLVVSSFFPFITIFGVSFFSHIKVKPVRFCEWCVSYFLFCSSFNEV